MSKSYLEMNCRAIESSWSLRLQSEFEKPYFKSLSDFVENEYQTGVIYPSKEHIFRAFECCPFENVKVVLLGQDPYHEPGQAHGLCFSVKDGIKLPPSLVNIFKELEHDLGLSGRKSGDLSGWAKQGVLMLNATLTVRAHEAGSHQNKGWEIFTDAVIAHLAKNCEGIVFILWGAYAQKKGAFIDEAKHLVLKSPHPSPLSAHRGFFGNHHFSIANDYLLKNGKEAVNW